MKVQVEQDHLTARLTVEAPDDTRAAIERDLELYGLVVAEKMEPEELLPDAMDVQALRHKFDLVQNELRLMREYLLAAQRSGKQLHERITSLGTDVAEFRQLIAQALGR